MLIDTRHARLPLCRGQFLRLAHARHTRLTALRGDAWITLDGDPRDIVLSPGQSFVVDSDSAVVVYPLRASTLAEIAIDTAAPAPRRHWWDALRALIAPPPPALAGVA
ncbi:MAG TPA: DUF2917 domain-containing protein [Albitalea sp.]|nr:DUF2917 domain-containing protein [Albitalea sp.]